MFKVKILPTQSTEDQTTIELSDQRGNKFLADLGLIGVNVAQLNAAVRSGGDETGHLLLTNVRRLEY